MRRYSKSFGHELLTRILESMRLGVVLVGQNGRVVWANNQARSVLGKSHSPSGGGLIQEWFAELEHAPVEISRHAEGDGVTFRRDNGTWLSVSKVGETEGHSLLILADATASKQTEMEADQLKSEFYSLFHNSICGIYRDNMDGKTMLANLALAKLNGYETVEEFLRAAEAKQGSWYASPARSKEFFNQLHAQGFVSDFVSEAVRHATGENYWISENAWLVNDELGRPNYIQGLIQDATPRVQAMAEIDRLINTDALTATSSRYRILSRLECELKVKDGRFALFIIDLDRFKSVNDLYGHLTGDALLKEIAKRLIALLPEGDEVGRLGGDEFAILSRDEAICADPERLALAVLSAARLPVEINGHQHSVGASVGIAIFPEHGSSAKELLTNADVAMYAAKRSAGWRVTDRELMSQIAFRQKVESELQFALERQQLEFHSQPMFDFEVGSVVGHEFLMRWHHPEIGPVAPGAFLPVAERTGMSMSLLEWTLREACLCLSKLRGSTWVSINVSPAQLGAPGLVKLVKKELEAHAVDPRRLKIEIAESSVLSGQGFPERQLRQLNDIGVGIALDDFGKGLANLAILSSLPIEILKIDRSLIAQLQISEPHRAIIRAVHGLAQNLGIGVIAEGVEERFQSEELMSLGVVIQQGFLIGMPQPIQHLLSSSGKWVPDDQRLAS